MTVTEEFGEMLDRMIVVLEQTQVNIMAAVRKAHPEANDSEIHKIALEAFPFNIRNNEQRDLDIYTALLNYKQLVIQDRVTPGDVYNAFFLIQNTSFVDALWIMNGGSHALPKPWEAMDAFAMGKLGVLS